jgi:murein DD-endopeptidase MepM/ murein hydrolase activator NlpD
MRKSQTKKRRWLLAGGIFLGLAVLAVFLFLPAQTTPPPPATLKGLSSETKGGDYRMIEGKVEAGNPLFDSLSEKKVPIRWIELIIAKLQPHLDFKKMKGGTYRVFLDDREELVKFVYEEGPVEIYEINRDGTDFVAQRVNVPLEKQLVKVTGEIQSSLFEAMESAGEQDTLTLVFAEILAWEIDFYMDVREGDRFTIIVDKLYKGKEFIDYGTIHAVTYSGQEKTVTGIRYRDDCYDENGRSLKRAFLKSPLRFNRISSRFSRFRKHPILGGLRPHYGVDYAAPTGTPVWAVGDGKVVLCGWNGGYGKQVVLRHMNGYMTHYGHLSRFGPGIRNGIQVEQKQVIGYVGSTGLSTGPHLDYRLAKGGQFRNPLKETFPTGIPITQGEMEGFLKRRDEVLTWLRGESNLSQSPVSSAQGKTIEP